MPISSNAVVRRRVLERFAVGALLGTLTLAASAVSFGSSAADRGGDGDTELTAGPPFDRTQVVPTARTGQPPDPLERLDTAVDVEVWKRVADCESGQWSADGDPKPGSARWNYGLEFDHGDHFEGGLNFHPDTWETYRDPDMPSHAGRASPPEEIVVAERVLEDQGWKAWPVCSEMVDAASEGSA
ncbi:MAG: transglycosylase family protein [Nitriliruptoraceae bacterium]